MLLQLLDPTTEQEALSGTPIASARVRLSHSERADAEPIVFVNSLSPRLLYFRAFWTDAKTDTCNGNPLGISETEVYEILGVLGLTARSVEKTDEFTDELYYFPIIRPEEILLRYGWWQVTITTDVDYGVINED